VGVAGADRRGGDGDRVAPVWRVVLFGPLVVAGLGIFQAMDKT